MMEPLTRPAGSHPRYGWFRLYAEVLNDPKVQNLPDRLFRAWINLLCVASQNEGILPQVEELAFLLRVKPAKANVLLEELRVVGLLDEIDGRIVPHNWKGRQYQSDNSTARVKRFRNGQRNVKRNVSNTVSETAPDTEANSDTEVAVSNATATAAPVVTNAPPRVEPNVDVPTALSNRRSMIRPEAFTLARQIAAVMGLDDGHPSTVGMPMIIEHWLATWHPEIILSTVRTIMATRRNDPPRTLKYFEAPIARAHAEQSRSLPIVDVPPAETINGFQKNGRGGGSLIATIDRELAKFESAEEADLAMPANPVLSLPS